MSAKETVTLDLKKLCSWGPPKRLSTAVGPRILRVAPPTTKFRQLMKSHKAKAKAAGLGWSKDKQTGEWQACWWQPDVNSANKAIKRYQESFEHKTDETLPCAEPYRPYGYQIIGANYTRRHRRCLLADDMGLGKSLQTILVTNAEPGLMNAIIVCPATLKINWEREFRKFGTRDAEIYHCEGTGSQAVQRETMRQARKSTRLRVWIINYDILEAWKEFMHSRTWDLVALDESHSIKSTKAKRTHVIRGVWDSSTRAWEGETKAKIRMCLSGTPLENDATELITSLQWLGVMKEFPRFNDRYGEGQNRIELNKKLRTICMVRRMKSEVLEDLPGKVRSVIEVSPGGDAVKALREAEAEVGKKIEEKLKDIEEGNKSQEDIDKALESLEKGGFGVPFEEISRIRKLTGEAKVEAAAKHIATLHKSISGKPIIAFTHHIDAVMVPLKEALEREGLRVGTICGNDSQKKKQAVVDAFQAGQLDVCLGQIRSAGVGLTLTKSSHVVFVEFDWVPSRMVQCEDRSCRIGQRDVVTVHILALVASLDSRMAELVAQKAEASRDILDVNHAPKGGEVTLADGTKRALDSSTEGKKATQEAFEGKPRETVKRTLEIDASAAEKMAKQEKRELAWEQLPVSLSEEQLLDLQGRLVQVASGCDGAREIDGMGFSKLDVARGRNLAFGIANFWDSGQIRLAQHFVWKYRRQCGAPDWMTEWRKNQLGESKS